MKHKDLKTNILFAIGMMFILFSCNQNAIIEQKENIDTIVIPEITVKIPEINADSLVKAIDMEKLITENNLELLEKKSLSTANLRAQIRQKWSKIEFSLENDDIVRIKTYPNDGISHQTEAFYFQDGKLILAFIEYEGVPYPGKSDTRVGKVYYYFKDAVIKEDPTNGQGTSVSNSDGERLLQEANEYIALFLKK